MRQGEWRHEQSIEDCYVENNNDKQTSHARQRYPQSTIFLPPVGICPLLLYNCLSVGLWGLHLKFMPAESLAAFAEEQEDMNKYMLTIWKFDQKLCAGTPEVRVRKHQLLIRTCDHMWTCVMWRCGTRVSYGCRWRSGAVFAGVSTCWRLARVCAEFYDECFPATLAGTRCQSLFLLHMFKRFSLLENGWCLVDVLSAAGKSSQKKHCVMFIVSRCI